MQGGTSFYDMILYDATVLTMNETQPLIENATVGIQGDRIALLTASEKLTQPAEAKRKIHRYNQATLR